jgi:outer membrane protein TolC
MEALQRLNDEVLAKIQAVPGAVDVDSSLESGQPEMVAHVNRALAADMGFDVGTVAMQLRSMVEGVVPTRLRQGDKEYDIRVRLAPEFRNDFQTLARTPLYSPRGALVRTADIVRMEPGVGPTNIQREARRRQAKIGVELEGRALGDVQADVDKAMATVTLPPNFQWGYAGDVELMQESAAAMGLALVLAVAFIYIVLASQFESFLEPFLIMLSLPLAIVGALLAMLLTGNNLGMPAMIGMVMLMGLVTKNAILLIDLTNQYVQEGMTVAEAILKAGPIRLRPILMTTMAMILGMLPSAMGRGEGGEFRAPISIATIGGLITSTALTLVVVPVAYLLLARMLEWLRSRRNRSLPALTPATRIAGIVVVLALVGWFLAASNAFAQTAPTRSLSDPPDQFPGTLSLTFDQAIERALAANQALKVTQEKVRESQGYVTEAKTNYLPQVNFSYLYTPSQRFPLIRIPPGIFGPDETTFQANFQRQNIMGFDITQPLYTGGRLRNAQALQESGLDATRLELERSRQDLQYRVVEVFYNALLKKQGVGVADEQIRLAETQLALAKARYDAGTVARLDVLQAEVQLANSRARRIQMTAEVDAAVQAVRTVLSLPQRQAIELVGNLDEGREIPGREALDLALPSRPDLRAFDARRDQAEFASRLADGEWKPSLAFRGSLQYQEDAFDSLLSTDNQNYTFGLALQVPLMASPGASARRSVAQAQKRQAEHGLQASTDQARLELETAWTTLQAAAEVVTTQQKALELARESVQIAQVSYENGVITSAELNDAQVRMLETEWTLLQAKYAKIVAAARAKVAAGVE